MPYSTWIVAASDAWAAIARERPAIAKTIMPCRIGGSLYYPGRLLRRDEEKSWPASARAPEERQRVLLT
jgi:hypothetical protein